MSDLPGQRSIGRAAAPEGQEILINRLLLALLADGHLLVEGAPGLAKTRAIKVLGDGIQGDFHRVQFTPDLLPADLTGTEIYRPQDGSFHFQQGPLFHNLVLADEINRAPAKVQSALLEAMQEHQVTIGGETFPLPEPFLVLATQNPIEQEGTYPLPEAQVDRFMLKLRVGYPDKATEKEIMRRMSGREPEPLQVVARPDEILAARAEIAGVYMDERIADYIVEVIHATREPASIAGLSDLGPLIDFGASPRATIYLATCSRAHAYLDGRGYVLPEDVKAIGWDVLRHRVLTSFEAEAEEITSDDVVTRVFEAVRVP